jgi:Bacterial SH3 domain
VIRRPLLALVLMSAIAMTFAIEATSSDAAVRRSLCAARANLRDSPDGFVIGRLRRPQRLVVLRRSANRRWTHVRVQSGLSGWVPSRSVCRRG